MFEIVRDPSPRVLRQFSAVLAILAGGAGIYLHARTGTGAASAAAFACAACGLAGVAYPRLSRPIFLGVSYATFPVGYAVSLAILAAVYFTVFPLVGGIMRLAGRDPLSLRRGRDPASGWKERPRAGPATRYLRQY